MAFIHIELNFVYGVKQALIFHLLNVNSGLLVQSFQGETTLYTRSRRLKELDGIAGRAGSRGHPERTVSSTLHISRKSLSKPQFALL